MDRGLEVGKIYVLRPYHTLLVERNAPRWPSSEQFNRFPNSFTPEQYDVVVRTQKAVAERFGSMGLVLPNQPLTVLECEHKVMSKGWDDGWYTKVLDQHGKFGWFNIINSGHLEMFEQIDSASPDLLYCPG